MDKKILILHGWGSSAQSWQKVKTALEERGAEVILPDLPGFGQNQILEKPWSIQDYAQWVFDFCQKKNLSQFFLMGHSFGGGVAVKLINSFPLDIRGLILVSPALRRRKGPVYWFVLFWAKIGKIVFFLPPLSFLQPLARKIIYFIIGKRDYYRLENKTIKKTFRNVVEEDMIGYLPAIKLPSLIVWGEEDKMTPLKDAFLVQKNLGNSQLEIIKQAGHALNLHNAGVLVEKILTFINKL